MSGPSVTLSILDAYIAAKPKDLTFPPAIETIYDEQMQTYRVRVMRSSVMPTVVVYNVFLMADALLLPKTIIIASILHFCVVTPAVFLVSFLYSRARNHWLRELAATVVPVLMVAQIMYIYLLNRGELASDHYQYLAIMIVIYLNVNQRFGYKLAVASTLLLMALYLGALLPGHSAFTVKFIGTAMMISTAYLSLLANRRMERDVRHAFLRRLQDQLRREGAEAIAKRDPLTGLANRRYLEEHVQTLWSLGDEAVSPVAVIMIDIDHFKAFNDCYGHAAGDDCLKQVATVIGAELRSDNDLGVRFGGEEFLMLLPRTDQGGATRVAERARRLIEDLAIPHERSGTSGVVTASFGIIAGPISAQSFPEALASADAALYAAKHNGRNQVWPSFAGKTDQAAAEVQSKTLPRSLAGAG